VWELLLKKVIFNDFRLYKGFNEIDLSVDTNKKNNIILIGAQNGSGKTSILEGILLALYGRQASLTTSETYDQMIRESLNLESYRNGNRKLSIEVEFEDNERNLIVKREWRIRDTGCFEELTILENSVELKQFEDELEKTQFIQSIIPFGVSQFFFFDAEKIQYMADDNEYEESLTSSIRDILNINIYQQLVDDLFTFEQNHRRLQADVKESDIIRIEADIKVISETISDTETKLDEAQIQAEKLKEKITHIKKWLREQGIGALAKRADTQDELDNIKEEREVLRDEFISFLEHEFSYIILYPLLEEANKQLILEGKYNEGQQLSKQNHDNFYKLINTLNSRNITPPLSKSQKETIAYEMQLTWAQINRPIIQENVEILHDMSKSDLIQLTDEISSLVEYLSNGKSDLGKTLLEYEELTNNISEKIQLLKHLPTNDNVLKKENELENLENEIGICEDTIRICQINLDELNTRKKNLQSKRTELIEHVKISQEIQIKINESTKLRKALDDFIGRLTIEKAKDVEKLLTEMFNKLARKDYLVKSFYISPHTFEVTFENFSGELLPKRRLSAGEKEIFSIALVWALAKAAQKPLPIVIDTPLGRLDKVHRANLLTHYFPHASQQVIILSTDEEVADEWKEMIDVYVVKEYLISDEGEHTKIREGYFNKQGVK
jgi:DNA sulfur modification protein DndD